MPSRPIDVLRQVCDFLQRYEQDREKVSKQSIMLAFSTFVSLDNSIVKKYLELGRQLKIWSENQDGTWTIDYSKPYDYSN